MKIIVEIDDSLVENLEGYYGWTRALMHDMPYDVFVAHLLRMGLAHYIAYAVMPFTIKATPDEPKREELRALQAKVESNLNETKIA